MQPTFCGDVQYFSYLFQAKGQQKVLYNSYIIKNIVSALISPQGFYQLTFSSLLFAIMTLQKPWEKNKQQLYSIP